METTETETKPCDCSMLEYLAEHRKYSVRFDQEKHAFFIDDWQLRYCFCCGGLLSQWKHPDYVTTPPEPDEEREADEILARCNSLGDVYRALGKPDCLAPYGSDVTKEWDRVQHVLHERHPDRFASTADPYRTREAYYTTRWRSLALIVYECSDGSIEYQKIGLAPGQYLILPKMTLRMRVGRLLARMQGFWRQKS